LNGDVATLLVAASWASIFFKTRTSTTNNYLTVSKQLPMEIMNTSHKVKPCGDAIVEKVAKVLFTLAILFPARILICAWSVWKWTVCVITKHYLRHLSNLYQFDDFTKKRSPPFQCFDVVWWEIEERRDYDARLRYYIPRNLWGDVEHPFAEAVALARFLPHLSPRMETILSELELQTVGDLARFTQEELYANGSGILGVREVEEAILKPKGLSLSRPEQSFAKRSKPEKQKKTVP